MRDDFDIIIIGSGPGGYRAALRCASLGKMVLVVEKDEIGGVCLNKGCIPTKSIITSAKLYSKIKKSQEFGINIGDVSFDWNKILERKNNVVSKLRKGIEYLFKKNNIEFIKGFGKILDSNTVEVKNSDDSIKLYKCSKIIIAAGSIPFKIKGFEDALTSDDVLALKEVPKNITIIGAGAIGVEFACIFNCLGSKVTLIEMADQILPGEDEGISSELKKILSRNGINISTKTVADKNKISSNSIILTTGRSFNKISTNNKMETEDNNIYAVGDITGIKNLAHVAQMQGIVAAENACGIKSLLDYECIPQCTFSYPEAASVGLTEQSAKEQGIEMKISNFNFAALGISQILNEKDGFVKLIADRNTDKLIGCHIIGEGASILISEAVLAIKKGLTIKDLKETIHAHPTLPEAIWEAAYVSTILA